MKTELVEKLALIYAQAHTTGETTPAQVYSMYKKAIDEIRRAESQAYIPTV